MRPFIQYFTKILFISFLIVTSAQAETVLHRGNQAEPGTMDMHYSSHVWESNIFRDMYEGLTTEGADGEVIPGVAERWDISDDVKTYTFFIRDDAKWSDGSPVTADDFIFAYTRILNPETASEYSYMLYPILNAREINTGKEKDFSKLGVKAVSDKILEINLAQPTPYFLELLTHHSMYPIKRSIVEKHGREWVKAGNVVTNGAYQFVQWKPQEYVEAIKNPHFHDAENVQIDRVFYYPEEDRNTAIRRFRAGEQDTVDEISDQQLGWLKKNLSAELKIAPFAGTYYYSLNVNRKPFNDVRVRRALSMAIDREFLVSKVLKSGEIAAYGFVPRGISNYEKQNADFADWSQEKRDARAKELMIEAGYGPDTPLTFELKYNTDVMHQKVAIAINQMWKKKLGVKVELFNSEAAAHYDMLDENNFDVGRAAWVADYNDAFNFLTLLDSRVKEHNYGRWVNKDFDALLDQAKVTIDLEKRAEFLQQAEKLMANEQPVIPIYFYVSKKLISQKIDGWIPNTMDKNPTRFLKIKR